MADFLRVDVKVLDVDYTPDQPKRFDRKSATATTVIFKHLDKRHWVEGSVAEKAAAIFQLDDRVTSLEFEPMCIRYQLGDRIHTYTPDALVGYGESNSHRRVLYEFKTTQYLTRNQDVLARNCSAAEQAGVEFGWSFRLITEDDLKGYSKLANFLLSFRSDEVVQIHRNTLLDHVHREGYITQAVVKAEYPTQSGELLCALWSLVARNELQIEGFSVPADDTRVILPNGFWAKGVL